MQRNLLNLPVSNRRRGLNVALISQVPAGSTSSASRKRTRLEKTSTSQTPPTRHTQPPHPRSATPPPHSRSPTPPLPHPLETSYVPFQGEAIRRDTLRRVRLLAQSNLTVEDNVSIEGQSDPATFNQLGRMLTMAMANFTHLQHSRGGIARLVQQVLELEQERAKLR